MNATLAQTAPAFNRVPRKPVRNTRRLTDGGRLACGLPHEEECEAIVRDFKRGLYFDTLKRTHDLTSKAFQDVLRQRIIDLESALAWMRTAARKPAFAVGVALLFCVGFESWQESQSGDEQTIQRAFRTSRARRSRRDGEADDSVWGPMHNPPEWLNQEAA